MKNIIIFQHFKKQQDFLKNQDTSTVIRNFKNIKCKIISHLDYTNDDNMTSLGINSFNC